MNKRFVIFLLAALLAACGPSPTPTSQAATPAIEQPTALPTPAPTSTPPPLRRYQPPPPLTPAGPITTSQAAKLTRLYRAGFGAVGGLALHPNQHLFAATSGIGVWLYETHTYTPVAYIPGEQAYAVQWSPDGAWLAIRQADLLLVYNPDSQQIYRVFAAGYGPAGPLAWSHDGTLLASADEAGRILVWNFESGIQAQVFYPDDPETTIHALAFSPSQQILAASYSTTSSSGIRIWQIAGGELQRELRGQTAPIQTLSWDSGTGLLASGAEDGSVWLWQVEQAQAITALIPPNEDTAPTRAIIWQTDDQLVTIHANGDLLIWDTGRGTLNSQSSIADFTPTAALWLPEHQTAVLVGDKGTLMIWDSSSVPSILIDHYGSLQAAAWSPDGQQIAAAAVDGKLHLFDGEDWAQRGSLIVSTEAFSQVSWSPDGQWLAASSAGQQLFLWDDTDAEPQIFDDANQEYTASNTSHPLAWSPDSANLAVSFTGQNIIIIQPSTQSEPLRLALPTAEIETPDPDTETPPPPQLNALAWSPDGALLAAGDDAGNLMIWDMAAGKLLQSLPAYQEQLYSLAWSPDGSLLAMSGSNGVYETELVRFWERDLTRLNDEIVLQWVAEVRGLAWSPDGSMIAVGYTDAYTNSGAIQLWDAAALEHMVTIPAHNAAITSLRWSPDSRVLLSTSRDGTLGFWGLTD